MRRDSSTFDPANDYRCAGRSAPAALDRSDDWMANIGYEAANPALQAAGWQTLLPRGIRWEESLDEIDGNSDG